MSLTGSYSHWQRAKLLTAVAVGDWVALFNCDGSLCFKKIGKTSGQLGFSELSLKSYIDSENRPISIYEIITLSYEKHCSIKTVDSDLELISLSGKN